MAKYSWLPFIKFRIPFTRNYIAIHKFDDYFFKTVYEIWYVKNIDDPQDCGHFCYDDPADCLEEAGELGEDSDNWECFKEHNHKEAPRVFVHKRGIILTRGILCVSSGSWGVLAEKPY